MEFPSGRHLIYLDEIGEPADNLLRLVLLEARASTEPVELPGTRIIASPIEHGPGCRVFELTWPSYVAYAVTNESFAAVPPEAPPVIDTLSCQSESAFLKHVARTTIASDDYPGPLKHWRLIALNHVVDVVGVDAPEVVLLPSRVS